MTAAAGAADAAAPTIPWRVSLPLLSTAFIMFGAGILGSLLPLRFSAQGFSDGVIGILATAEAVGFLVACLHAHRIIAAVGLERAYAAFAGLKAVAILGLHFADGFAVLAVLRFLIGMNAAGLAVVVESWLNALAPNAHRGRVLTLYVLTYAVFFGVGQLFGHNLNVLGPEMLFIAGISTTLALVPMVAIDVHAPAMPRQVQIQIARALANSPVSVLACLLNGLVLTAFITVGPLFGARIGLSQGNIVLLMACVSFGGLLLQWPIGYLSDKMDRLYTLIAVGAGTSGVAFALVHVSGTTSFVLLALLFAVFGGLAESLYAVGVAHANDRASSADYVALSSTLLFVWALGAAIGPTTGTYAIQFLKPSAFFVYVMSLSVPFSLFAAWRLYYRHRKHPAADSREEFLAYPQTSPEIYGWLPYHKRKPADVQGDRNAPDAIAGADETRHGQGVADQPPQGKS